jgi:hypothetical protein
MRRAFVKMKGAADGSSTEQNRKDFDLCRPIGRSAWLVYERNKRDREKDYEPHVLQSCHKQHWTEPRAQLVDIARESRFFVRTNFVFPEGDDICIASHPEDICLVDMIDGTMPMTEEHASAVLTQVSSFTLVELRLKCVGYTRSI